MKKIRWGIAAPGAIANKFAKAVKNVEGAELVAVAARSGEKAKAFAEKYDIPNVFEGYEKMAEWEGVDAVYVATPHPFHKPVAEIYLNAKKHVLCEKPICVNVAQATALKECAAKNGVFLMEAMWTRFLPAIKEAQEIVENGEIGDVLGIEADFCYRIEPEEDSKVFKNEIAGGSLLDVGVYGLHFAAVFLGNSPESVVATANVQDGVDLHTVVALKYKDGAVANITSAINLHKPETAYIYGTKGHIYLPNFYGAQEIFVAVGGDARYIEKSSIGEGFEEEIIEVCDCIRAGKLQSDILPLDESIAILKIMDESRKQIDVKYPFD